MKLHVCYGAFGPAERHAYAKAYKALIAAGHAPKISRTFGCYGTVIDGSKNIVAWAIANRT